MKAEAEVFDREAVARLYIRSLHARDGEQHDRLVEYLVVFVVMPQECGYAAGVLGEKHRDAADARWTIVRDVGQKILERDHHGGDPRAEALSTGHPGGEHHED